MNRIGIFAALTVGTFVVSGCSTHQCPKASTVEFPSAKSYAVTFENSPSIEAQSIEDKGDWIKVKKSNVTFFVRKEMVKSIICTE